MSKEEIDIEIEESEGEVDVEESAWMLFGPPKIGKSKTASGWPNPLFLCTSLKEIARIKVPFILINTHEKFVAAIDLLLKDKSYRKKYKTIVVDFIDAAFINCQAYVCKKLHIEHASEAGYGKGVDMIDSEWRRAINKLVGSDYGCIFISHLQIKEVQTMNGTVTKAISTLPDRARRAVVPLVSVIGCIDFETIKIKDEDSGKVKFKKRRIISFEPSEFLEAGDRDGYLPSKIPCFSDPKRTFHLIEDYYTGKKVAEKLKEWERGGDAA